MVMTTAGSRLANARAEVQKATSALAQVSMHEADKAAEQRQRELAAKAKQPTFRMSAQVAAQKLCYDGGLPRSAERWFAEIFSRLEQLESSATPAHMRGVEKRG